MVDYKTRPHALIVGASGGLGLACLQRFKANYNISAISRRAEFFEGVGGGDSFRFLKCDICSPGEIDSAFFSAVQCFGKISALILCAGVQLIKPIRMLKAHELREVVDVNFTSVAYMASLFASQKISSPEAVMCIVSSIAAARPEPGIVLYSATKAACEAMVAGLARELAPKRVVGVAPGWMDTEMTRSNSHIYTKDFVEGLERNSPVGIATVEDVADVIEFLVSSRGKRITGRVLAVDGGSGL